MNNVILQTGHITQTDRERYNGYNAVVVWLTGLSGSGKSTIAYALEQYLFDHHLPSYVLDGDNLRHGLCSDLAFSEHDRKENLRRVGEVTKLFSDAGMVVIASFISPYESDREHIRQLIGKDRFIEVYVKCPIDVCETRDVKGLYKKARQNKIPEFTGISSPYEEPKNADVVVDTSVMTVNECIGAILTTLYDHLR